MSMFDFKTTLNHNKLETLAGKRISQWALLFYTRIADEAINDVIVEAIKERIRTSLMQDEIFRAQIEEAIKHVVATLPIDVIVKAVRQAIRGDGL